jgi:HEPN domain-containing protein
MNSSRQVDYRLRLAQGFLGEAIQDIGLSRWRSAMDNAQLSVENAAKAALALLGPVGRTHFPASLLRNSIAAKSWNDEHWPLIERLAELTELLGFDVHMQTDYGDEADGLTPWELFDEEDALMAVGIAEEAVRLTSTIVYGSAAAEDESK